jgi:hypothetical protein
MAGALTVPSHAPRPTARPVGTAMLAATRIIVAIASAITDINVYVRFHK